LYGLRRQGRAVSLQFSILKVLAGQPNGRATVPDLNRYIRLLSVPEWTARMKRLSALAPNLDIFGSQYVAQDNAGWQLTEAGRAFLAAIEMPTSATDQELTPVEVVVTPVPARQVSAPRLRLVANNRQEPLVDSAKDYLVGTTAVA
jgi:hypothetical protein